MQVSRGEIYFVDLNPAKGREQTGTRPVLALSSDVVNSMPLVATVVVGTKGTNVSRDYATTVRVPVSATGLPVETVFLCFQIRSLDISRFTRSPVGSLAAAYLTKVEDAVRYCLDL